MTSDAASAQTLDDRTLSAHLAALEAENERLRTAAGDGTGARDGGDARKPHRGVWRGVLSAVCIVVASLLVPASIVSAWARVQLVDENQFVATFAPLASDPAVQSLVADRVTTAIDSSIDLTGITNDLFDGLAALNLPPRADAAIQLLRVPAAQGLENLVDSTVTRLVQSDGFQNVWTTALRASHRGLAAAAGGGTANGAVAISDTGEVGIQLAPIIEEVKQALVDRGVGFAAAIPAIDRTIVIVQSDALVTVAVVYNLAVAVGTWLSVVALVLFVVGILLARRRSAAFLGTGIGLAFGAGGLAVGLGIGGAVLAVAATTLGVPPAALAAVYDQVIDAMRHTALVITLIGVILAVLAWIHGRSRAAGAIRAGVGSVNSGLRHALAARGVDTGRFGAWMYTQHVLARAILIILLMVWLLLLRPLSAGDVFLVLIVGLLAWWLAELVQRRPDDLSRSTGDSAR